MRDKNYYEGLINQLTVAHPFWNSTDIAYEIILQGIISGYWKSGEKIPQDQLSTMLDMSRTPIRMPVQGLWMRIIWKRMIKTYAR